MPKLELIDLRKRNGPSFEVSATTTIANGTTVLLGANGAGKSTLIRLLATSEEPSSGEYRLDDVDVLSRSGREDSRRRIGWLPQVFGYDPATRVIDYLQYMGWMRGLKRSEVLSRSQEALTLVGLESKAQSKLREISGGMLRRVGIAQAVVANPSLVLLDEPSAGLDPVQRIGLHKLVKAISMDRIVVFATHLLEDLDAVADSIVVMRNGKIAYINTYDDALRQHGREGLQRFLVGEMGKPREIGEA